MCQILHIHFYQKWAIKTNYKNEQRERKYVCQNVTVDIHTVECSSTEKKLQITTVVKVQNCGETDVKSMTITLAAVKDIITKQSVS